MFNNLEKLSMLSGVSGREAAVRDYIINKASELADQLTVDPTGSVIAVKRGAQSGSARIMLAAHMDEVGLIITHICSDGTLKFAAVGGIDPRVICGRTVLVGDNSIPGVIGITPIHLSQGDSRSKCPSIDSMYIDIGASSGDEAKALVTPGEICLFNTAFERLGDGRIKGKALDDRAGCAVLLELMKQEYPCDVWFAFTTMEEVGLRGAGCAAYTIAPDYALVVEATTAADIPNVDEASQVCHVGGGAVVGFMDRRTIYDRELFDRALAISHEKAINVQIKQAVAGGNDSGAIQVSRSGVRTLAVSLPCRYLHAPAAVIAEADLNAVYELVYELLMSLCTQD